MSARRAAPFTARTEEELAACGLRQEHAQRRSVLEMTDRETEVAHLVEQGMTNAQIATELFVTPKAVEYHLGHIYAKFGLKGRQAPRRLLSDSRRPSPPQAAGWIGTSAMKPPKNTGCFSPPGGSTRRRPRQPAPN